MLKEIHEQPRAVANTLQERVANGRLLEAAFGPKAQAIFPHVDYVHIVACGTSYHAGMVAQYFIEQICRIPCRVEIASEYRYRNPVVPKNSLFVTHLAVRRDRRYAGGAAAWPSSAGYLATLAICNAPESSLVRESDLVMLTRAGPEIGVASTKAFTTQIAALSLLVIALAKTHGSDAERERGLVTRLVELPGADREDAGSWIRRSASWPSASSTSTMRCSWGAARWCPIALEGALKLKEISYIHAEGLRRRRAEARSAGAGGCRTCPSSPSRRTTTCSRS